MTRKQEVAKLIHAHLQRQEKDPVANYKSAQTNSHQLFMPAAWSAGRWVYVRLISYQHQWHMTLAQAEKYLAALDANPAKVVRPHEFTLQPSALTKGE